MADEMELPTARPCLKCGEPRGCGGARGLCQDCYDEARQSRTLNLWPTVAERRAREGKP